MTAIAQTAKECMASFFSFFSFLTTEHISHTNAPKCGLKVREALTTFKAFSCDDNHRKSLNFYLTIDFLKTNGNIKKASHFVSLFSYY